MNQLWQIAAGEPARDYREVFLNHDLMLIGPGNPGPVVEGNYPGLGIMAGIRSFYRDPMPGDPVLLRLGHEVIALGRIPDTEGYSWNPSFNDVFGWNLQHVRRVQWEPRLLKGFESLRGIFADRKQQPTFSRVHVVDHNLVAELADKIKPRSLKPLPDVGPVLSREDLGIELFSSGVSNEVIDQLLRVMEQVKRLSAWYGAENAGTRPNEHEVVAHVLVPLLRSLGWSEQLLGVEWRRVDIAVFSQTPTIEKNCVAVFEAKSLGRPLGEAFNQAREYVERLGLVNCRRIVTADGGHLMVHKRMAGAGWEEQPSGYLNCSLPRDRHLIPQGSSSTQTIVDLLPGNIGRA